MNEMQDDLTLLRSYVCVDEPWVIGYIAK